MKTVLAMVVKSGLILFLSGFLSFARADYQVDTFPKSMTSILGQADTITLLTPTSTESFITLNLPFSFNYFNQTHFSLVVDKNGFIAFAPLDGSEADQINQALPDPMTPNGVVALFWDELIVQGEVAYQIQGSTPNRKLIIEYASLGDGQGNSNVLTGQIHLYESSHIIEFYYATESMPGVSPSASIGLENQDGSVGIGGPNSMTNNDIPDVNYRFTPLYYRISGKVYGLVSGRELWIGNNGNDSVIVNSIGEFEMQKRLSTNDSYTISINVQPQGQSCFVYNGAGTISDFDVVDVGIYCTATIYSFDASYKYYNGPVFYDSVQNESFVVGGSDYLYKNWWFYRTGSDIFERQLPQPDQISIAASTLSLLWFDVDDRGLFDLALDISLSEQANTGAMLRQVFKVSNRINQDIQLDVFKFSDYDMGIVSQNSATLEQSPDYIKITGSGLNPLTAELRAGGNSAYQVGSSANLFDLLSDNSITNLGNTGLPFNSGDFAGVFQWSHTVPAVGELTIEATEAIGTASAQQPADPIIFGLPRSISVNLSRLAPGNEIIMQNNGTDNLIINTNGMHTFPLEVVDGQLYNIQVILQPSNNSQICRSIGPGYAGSVNGQNIVVDFECVYKAGAIIDGNAVLTYKQNIGFNQADFFVDSTRVAYRTGWFYRLDFDGKEFLFPIPDTSSFNGNTVVFEWFDVDGRGFFSAKLTQSIEQDFSDGALVSNQFEVNNRVSVAAGIHLYNYVDFDIDTAQDDVATLINANNYLHINDYTTVSSVNEAEFRAGGNTDYEVSDGFQAESLYIRLRDDEVDNLSNSSNQTDPTDIDAAFQWFQQVPASGSITIYSAYAGGSSIAPEQLPPVIFDPELIFKNSFE